MTTKRRTKQQNEDLVREYLEYLAKGGDLKDFVFSHNIRYFTFTKIVSNVCERNGFKTLYQFLAAYITVKEQARMSGRHGRPNDSKRTL